tara:strand:+ start:1141 stop:1773 length:633 start_codon:yes stop_codon:yes gene_type:complete
MSKISLKHSGGNVVSLNSPTNAPGAADVAFKLPNQDGSANEFLKTDGSGNLSFGAAGGGKFASYAIIADVKSNTTNGGTFTTGDWRVRDLQTEVADADGIVSLSNNQFTLPQAGSYFIHARMPYMMVGFCKMKLYNVTDSSDVIQSEAGYSSTGVSANFYIDLKTRITIASSKAFDIRMAGQVTRSSYGYGYASQFGPETYTTVVIFKES